MCTTAMGSCTCGCPDGPDQHLENCESYLRYWEVDQLQRIELHYDQLIASHPLAYEVVNDLVSLVVSFTKSTTGPGTSISDPASVIRRHVNAARQQPTLLDAVNALLEAVSDLSDEAREEFNESAVQIANAAVANNR